MAAKVIRLNPVGLVLEICELCLLYACHTKQDGNDEYSDYSSHM